MIALTPPQYRMLRAILAANHDGYGFTLPDYRTGKPARVLKAMGFIVERTADVWYGNKPPLWITSSGRKELARVSQ